MKIRKIVGLLLLVLLFSESRMTEAAELPLKLKVEYMESQEELLVSVIASEPVVLEAFTFSVVFDYNSCKLYNGYDVLEKGYAYTQEFSAQQEGGMMLSNALDDRVIFSGVRSVQNTSSGSEDAFEGTIAHVALLKYHAGEAVPEIALEISALRYNGNTADVSSGEPIVWDSKLPLSQCESMNSELPDDKDELLPVPTAEDKKDYLSEGHGESIGNSLIADTGQTPEMTDSKSASWNSVSSEAVGQKGITMESVSAESVQEIQGQKKAKETKRGKSENASEKDRVWILYIAGVTVLSFLCMRAGYNYKKCRKDSCRQ